MFNPELKSELQRQASEREMIQVKQQQLRKLTARDDINDPKVLHARLLDERAEKERFQDSLNLKDKTIKVMRAELNHTLQEKLQLENAVKSLQVRIDKLESQTGTPSAESALASLVAWSPLMNVRENIQNFERRTRSFRSGSVDTGVDRLRSTWQQRIRSFSPLSPKHSNNDKRHTYDFKLDYVDPIAPFKLSNADIKPLQSVPEEVRSVSPPPIRRTVTQPSSRDRRNSSPGASSMSSPSRARSTSTPTGDLSAEPSSPRSMPSSPRGVSFRDLSTVHVYQDESTASTPDVPRADVNSPRVPRIKLFGLVSSSAEGISPRGTRHTIGSSPRHTTPPGNSSSPPPSQSHDLNSPRNPRHSTPVTTEVSSPRILGINTISFGNKTKGLMSDDQPHGSLARTVSYTGIIKRKNSLGVTNKKGVEADVTKRSNSSKGNKPDDQRIFDVQKHDTISKPASPSSPASPVSPAFPSSPKSASPSLPVKLRLLIQKQPKDASNPSLTVEAKHDKKQEKDKHEKKRDKKRESKDAFRNSPSPLSMHSPIIAFPPAEPPKSPRSPNNAVRPNSPRNAPHSRDTSSTTSTTTTTPTTTSPSSSIPASPPTSPRSRTNSDVSDDSATSPRHHNRRTLSFPTPRVHNGGNSPPDHSQSPRPTRSQTSLGSSAVSQQDLHNLAMDVDKMRKEVYNRLCGCVEIISSVADYTQTIEISKSVRLLIKYLDLALAKLGIDQRHIRLLGTGRSMLPEIKPLGVEDSRLQKLRDVLVISLDRIMNQMRCLSQLVAQITTQEEALIITQTLGELQLFFSKQDKAITKLGTQDVVDGIHTKIENLKVTWQDVPLARKIEIAKVVLDLKKDLDGFCADNRLQLPQDAASLPLSSLSGDGDGNAQSERITKTTFTTLDKIDSICNAILHQVKNPSLQQSDDGSLADKLLVVFKSLSTK